MILANWLTKHSRPSSAKIGGVYNYRPDVLKLHSPFTRAIRIRAGVEEMAEEGPVLERVVVEREAVGREAVVVEAEARVAQPMIRKWSLCQYRHKSRSP